MLNAFSKDKAFLLSFPYYVATEAAEWPFTLILKITR